MDYSIYIIKQNTPESRLLPHAGIDRKELEIVKWKGRMRYRGGFGEAPVEWRINNIDDVKKLCESIIRILGKRKNLNPEESRAILRAKKTLKGIQNAHEKELKQESVKRTKKDYIITLIKSYYPALSDMKCESLASNLSGDSFLSITNFLVNLKRLDYKEIDAVEKTRKIFCKTMEL